MFPLLLRRLLDLSDFCLAQYCCCCWSVDISPVLRLHKLFFFFKNNQILKIFPYSYFKILYGSPTVWAPTTDRLYNCTIDIKYSYIINTKVAYCSETEVIIKHSSGLSCGIKIAIELTMEAQSNHIPLLTPYKFGEFDLSHRFVFCHKLSCYCNCITSYAFIMYLVFEWSEWC